MAGATFGRKGMAAAAPVGRRAQFLAPSAANPRNELEQRREAFIAAERARAGDAIEADPMASAVRAKEVGLPVFAGRKSVATAYSLWLFLGMISAHRFYLGRPITAVAQTCLWYVSLMFWMAGYHAAFFPMIAGLSWLGADLVLIPAMRRSINEKLQAKAEAQAWQKKAADPDDLGEAERLSEARDAR